MPSAAKEQFVSNLTEELKKSDHILLTEYQGLKAEEFTELRQKLRDVGAKYKVVKNRLAKIALKNIGKEMDQYMTGPSAMTYMGTDIAAVSKALFEFNKGHENLKVKAGYIFGKVVDKKELKEIADLPSRDQLLATLLATINSPLTTLLRTLNEPLRGLATALSEVAKKKEAAGAAS